jgi:lysophospholipase L1-like esterase
VKVLYAVRDIPLPPPDCPFAEQRRAQLTSAMAAEFNNRGMEFLDWTAMVASASGQRDLGPLHGFGSHRGAGHLNFDGHRAWAKALVDLLKTQLPKLQAPLQPAS